MQKEYNFAVEEIKRIEFSDYDEQEFSIARLGYISTRPNSHGIGISEDCLRESAPSALGKWVVANMVAGDCGSHDKEEHIVGMIPQDQEVEFVEDDDGYLRAYCDAIISKRYAADFCEIFEKDNNRAVSIEARFDMEDDDNAKSFTICGVTVLGQRIKPSCPDSDIEFVRFSEADAEDYYRARHVDAASSLKQFVETRKQSMAEKKTYKVDKSKESMSNADWSDVDKVALRDKIMGASNRAKLVKDVYLLVEDGWEDAPSEHLKYPIMAFDGDILVYYRRALSAALTYAKQNDETAVVNKIEKIYKKLDLDDTDGKEEKMSMEIEFAAVNIGDLWGRLWHEIDETRHLEYGIEGIYEEDNKKFAILRDRAQKLYRLDFSLTEEGLTVADEIVEVEQEFIETDNMKKFAEPENVADYRIAEQDDDDNEGKMSEDEMMAKIAQLEKDIEERDNIIMERDTELADLREYKKAVMAKENACAVEAIMAEIKPFVNDEQFAAFREEGLACDETNFDAWSNKVKAVCFSEVKKSVKKDDMGVFTFAAPIDAKKTKSTSVWDRL